MTQRGPEDRPVLAFLLTCQCYITDTLHNYDSEWMSRCFVLPHPDPLEGVFPPTVSNFPHFQRPLGCGDPKSHPSWPRQVHKGLLFFLTVFSSLTGVFLAVPQGFKAIYHTSHTWFLQKYQKLYHNKPNTLHGSHFSYLISLKIC